MVKFKPIKRKPGDLIRSEDWNKIQEDIYTDLRNLELKLETLIEHVNRLTSSVILTNMSSLEGTAYDLDYTLPGETKNFGIKVLGHINKQWVLEPGRTGVICRFAIIDTFDLLYYWASAGNGDKPALEITLEYIDGTIQTFSNIYIHEYSDLRPKGTANPYVEYLLSPTECVFYKYALKNPVPEKEVRYITFKNTNPSVTLRIGNVIHYLTRVRIPRV